MIGAILMLVGAAQSLIPGVGSVLAPLGLGSATLGALSLS
jgi:hypothetical protein